MSKRLAYVLAAIVILAAGGLGYWYYKDHHKSADQTPTTSQSQTEPTTPGTSSATGGNSNSQTYDISVYFSKHTDSDNDPAKTFPLARTSPDLGVANFAITQLLKGPTAAESAQGYFTTAKLRSGTAASDFKLAIDNGTATIQFLKPFDHLGVVADGQADSEIKATLKQFNTVQKVVILNYQGNCEFDLSGQNLCKR